MVFSREEYSNRLSHAESSPEAHIQVRLYGLSSLYLRIYSVYTYPYKQLITVKMESMNLKDSEGGFIGAYKGREKKGEMW